MLVANAVAPASVALATLVNTCPDPSFEHDTVNSAPAAWFGSGGAFGNPGATLTATNVAPFAGSNCMKVVTTATAFECCAVNPSISMVAGQTYWVSLYLKGNAGGETIQILLGNGGEFGSSSQTLTTGWQQFSVSHMASANGSLQLAVRTTTATAMTFFVDNVLVINATSLPSYFDGDSPGCSWAGTPGNSNSLKPTLGTSTEPSVASSVMRAATI